ncbi:MAG: CapA family protein [Chloroflexota bacterium]|nr:CapA family protein [Chloroflexota bacterium]
MKLTTPSRRALWIAALVGLGLIAALFAACGSPAEPAFTPTPTRTPRPTLTPIPSPVPPTPTPAWPVTVFVPDGLPAPAADALETAFADHADLFIPSSSSAADVAVTLNPGPDATLFIEWVYAIVAPFPTLTDEVAWTDVISTWSGAPAGPFAERPLLMTADTAAALTILLGAPVSSTVEITSSDKIIRRAWDDRPAWAIVPFDQLEPRWKVLRVDGVSVLDKDLDAEMYPLVIHLGLTGLERGIVKFQETVGAPLTNRDPDKMTIVLLTGVTALTRGTGIKMDQHGVTYPAQDIRDWLLEADITHISSEVSFAENCPPPTNYTTMVFCSNPAYIGLLEDIDVDVVELTGNHLLDWGLAAMENSLTMYEERDMPYYGGGWNAALAREPLTLTSGMHTFGFIGCNPAGPPEAWAAEERAGSAPCNFGALAEQLGPQIRQLREQGVIPIVTLQYLENPTYEPTGLQRIEFRALSEAGAVIVSGSQAHQPQGFDFVDGAFIHYGLGNLFFDQMQALEYRQEFLDRHVFYDGRHISAEVLTAMLEDYARPRPMTASERETFLTTVFEASGW